MWGQIAGAALGAIGGGKKKGGGGGTPKFIGRQIKRGFNDVNAASAAHTIGPQNADQLAAQDMIRSNVGLGAGNIQEAVDMARRAGNGVQPGDISKFYNPYEDQVIGSAVGDLERSRDMNLLNINAQAEAAGAFGGDREAVAKALASEDYNRNIASTVSGLRFSGYNSALDAAFRNNDAALSGSRGLLDATTEMRRAAYGDAAALGASGDAQFGYNQSLLDHDLNMAQLRLGAGTSALGASRPGASTGGGISGAMSGAAGGFDLFGDLFG